MSVLQHVRFLYVDVSLSKTDGIMLLLKRHMMTLQNQKAKMTKTTS